MNLNELPVWPQRQDAVIDQLQDLVRVANRLGMYDAADAVRHICETNKYTDVKYGCHLESDIGEPVLPDCVLDYNRRKDCSYCMSHPEIERREQCEHWKIISNQTNDPLL